MEFPFPFPEIPHNLRASYSIFAVRVYGETRYYAMAGAHAAAPVFIYIDSEYLRQPGRWKNSGRQTADFGHATVGAAVVVIDAVNGEDIDDIDSVTPLT